MADPAPDFRALCAEPIAHKAYVAFVQICKGGSDDAGTYESDEELVRLALKRLDVLESAALAQPAPEPPTDEELQALWIDGNWYNEGATPREFMSIARLVLARWGQGNA